MTTTNGAATPSNTSHTSSTASGSSYASGAAPSTSTEAHMDRRVNPQRAMDSFSDASRAAFNIYLVRGDEPRRHFTDEDYDDVVGWCTNRVTRSEGQRSHMRVIQRSYAFFAQEERGKKGLYRRPIKDFTWRKVLRKHEVFNAIKQSHLDVGHGGE
ncbi:hypothetical protein B0J12DRAFT_702392 [Macrophomina phaseolina]|uniref:Integrase zinc-binding domain-containing protein n=1 Tax=Macrophomina phaseolina TaxID=35725 RepID=A0ABQ8G1T2_9PEZI|nr:hypothetical protein B0J12DRAFT_702392 [Macrophomina phaseolina]